MKGTKKTTKGTPIKEDKEETTEDIEQGQLEKVPPFMDKTKRGVRMNERRNKMRNARMKLEQRDAGNMLLMRKAKTIRGEKLLLASNLVVPKLRTQEQCRSRC